MTDKTPDCGYCRKPAALVSGDIMYPHRPDLGDKMFWKCPGTCGAYVGCHPGTSTPLGTLADAQLRRARAAAHAAFDPVWKDHRIPRRKAYRWLAGKLGIDPETCHVGGFDLEGCRRVIQIMGTPEARAILAGGGMP